MSKDEGGAQNISFGWVGVSQGGGSVPKMFLLFCKKGRRGISPLISQTCFTFYGCFHISQSWQKVLPPHESGGGDMLQQKCKDTYNWNDGKFETGANIILNMFPLSSRRKTIWGSIKFLLLRWNGDVENKVKNDLPRHRSCMSYVPSNDCKSETADRRR